MHALATSGEIWADIAHWLIGTPLVVLGLVLLGLVTRWVAHRMIDRMVRHAEVGILPQRLTAMSVRGVSISDASPSTTPRPPGGCSGPRPWAACSRAS